MLFPPTSLGLVTGKPKFPATGTGRAISSCYLQLVADELIKKKGKQTPLLLLLCQCALIRQRYVPTHTHVYVV